LIERPGEPPLLVEIKSNIGSAAVQQGFGQLLLYNGIYVRLGGPRAELVLLLPEQPRSDHLLAVLREHDVCIATYGDYGAPNFNPDFLRLCRASTADRNDG
jgi:hypothetical protein